jgi:hypothetical protein
MGVSTARQYDRFRQYTRQSNNCGQTIGAEFDCPIGCLHIRGFSGCARRFEERFWNWRCGRVLGRDGTAICSGSRTVATRLCTVRGHLPEWEARPAAGRSNAGARVARPGTLPSCAHLPGRRASLCIWVPLLKVTPLQGFLLTLTSPC